MSSSLLQSKRVTFAEASGDASFSLVINWMERFLAAPHADLGRGGDVCPYIKKALTKDTIEYFRNTSEDIISFEEEIKRHLVDFVSGDRSDILRARIILPTRLKDADVVVDTVQRRLKSLFVEQHLMVGQFFETCNEPGLWNDNFHPLQTPVPLLAIRSMAPTDVAFLHYDAEFLESYIDKFGERGITALEQFKLTKEARN
jgi:hypothetical protein